MEKTLDRLAGWGVAGLFALIILAAVYDWGHAQELVNLDKGTYTEMRRINVTSDTARQIWPDSQKLQDSSCQAIGGAVWAGTSTVTSAVNITHPNVLNGQLVMATGTITLNGSFRGGTVYVTGDATQSTVTLRCLDFLTR